MPQFRIPEKHKQGNKSSFVVHGSEIASTEMIGFDLAVFWIASRGRWVGPEGSVQKEIDASKELRNKLASLPIEQSHLLVEGRLEESISGTFIKIPGGYWPLVAISDEEEIEGEYEWRLEGLGGGDWTAVLTKLGDPSFFYVDLRIRSDFVFLTWPSWVKPKDPNRHDVPEREVIRTINGIHKKLGQHYPELMPLTLAEAENLLSHYFPKAGKRRLREIYEVHVPERASRGRKRSASQRIQKLEEFRKLVAAAELKP
jgi:hypothetical protein